VRERGLHGEESWGEEKMEKENEKKRRVKSIKKKKIVGMAGSAES